MNNNADINPSTTTTSSTTLFVNDAAEKTQSVRAVTLDSSLAVVPTDLASIRDFMSKPYQISAFPITSSDIRNSVALTVRVFDYVYGSSVPNVWKNKMSGYNLIRGTACLKIVLNAQPFQAGRLLLHFLPNERDFSVQNTGYTKIHNTFLCSKTQQPCVEFDIQDGTATLEVPYIAPELWFSRTNGYDWGTFYLSILSPIASSASATVNATAFLSFKDFELAAPIYGPESGVTAHQKKERAREKPVGIASSFMGSLSKTADILVGVPIIGEYASVFSTVAATASTILSWFGWSRPIDSAKSLTVKQHPQYQGFNFNGSNASDVLAMDSMNQLDAMNDFAGSHVDEMSFSYLKTIPAYIRNFSWSTSNNAGLSIFRINADMSSLTESSSVPSGTGNAYVSASPPFVFLSRYHRYYRGSVILTLKIVKTQFHSGRLAVSFTPSTSNIPTGNQQSTYVYRDIIDVSQSDTFSFTLPYMHPAPFLSTGWNDNSEGSESIFGTFDITVLNPLVAATTVSTSVDILVYASAGPDFTLSALSSVTLPIYKPEMNTDFPRVEGPIGDSSIAQPSTAPHSLCTGEVFLSVKQLYQLLRPMSVLGYNLPTADTPVAGFTSYRIYPFANSIPVVNPVSFSAPSLELAAMCCDYISELSHGYAYSRGGVRVVDPRSSLPSGTSSTTSAYLSPTGGPTQSYISSASNFPSLINVISASTGNFLSPLSVRTTQTGSIDTIVPHYGRTPMRLNYPIYYGSAAVPIGPDVPDTMLNVAYPTPASSNRLFPFAMRSGADDYATGYFLGFPPFVTALIAEEV